MKNYEKKHKKYKNQKKKLCSYKINQLNLKIN